MKAMILKDRKKIKRSKINKSNNFSHKTVKPSS